MTKNPKASPLDNEAWRVKRATIAGKASGYKRRGRVTERDRQIYQAFLYLTGARQSTGDHIATIKLLSGSGLGVNLPETRSPYTFIGEHFSLSRQRVHQIVGKYAKEIVDSSSLDR